ncbi:MAG: S-layer homology domain-containing protein, partial [Tissierellia bacterium]|nr:S-layer homology domain-containing protein [Tissierellia bacterium]
PGTLTVNAKPDTTAPKAPTKAEGTEGQGTVSVTLPINDGSEDDLKPKDKVVITKPNPDDPQNPIVVGEKELTEEDLQKIANGDPIEVPLKNNETLDPDTDYKAHTEDPSGNKSKDVPVTVKPKDNPSTPSKEPTIDPVTEGDKTISGGGVPNANISIKIPGVDTPIETTVDSDGKWKVPVPEGKDLEAGEEITATQTEEGKTPSQAQTTVKEKDDPETPPIDDDGNWGTIGGKPKEKGEHLAFIYGYPDKSVRPGGNITRAEAAAMISRLAGLDLSDNSKAMYDDTPSAWYNPYINAMVKKDLMFGKDGKFRPNEPITRGEFARALYYIDHESNKVAPFEDVKGHPYEEAINQAYGNGRIMGYPDGTFRPDAAIQRAEAARLLNRFAGRCVQERGVQDVWTDLIGFTDLPVNHWAYYEILEAANSHRYYRIRKYNVEERWIRILELEQR